MICRVAMRSALEVIPYCFPIPFSYLCPVFIGNTDQNHNGTSGIWKMRFYFDSVSDSCVRCMLVPSGRRCNRQCNDRENAEYLLGRQTINVGSGMEDCNGQRETGRLTNYNQNPQNSSYTQWRVTSPRSAHAIKAPTNHDAMRGRAQRLRGEFIAFSFSISYFSRTNSIIQGIENMSWKRDSVGIHYIHY